MNKKDLIKDLIISFREKIPYSLIERETELTINSGKIVTVCGVRRSGKTFLLYQTINKLVLDVSIDRIFFLSFDDERMKFKTDELDLILQAFREMNPEIAISESYLFFDEIQMIDGWEQFVRRIYDQETKNIFISGSNSRMLATDISTSLRGRTITFELFPLNFNEYCKFRELSTIDYYTPARTKLVVEFKKFNQWGAFPEIVVNDYSNKEKILQDYYLLMLFKDIVERYDIRNIPVLKYFVSRLISNLSKPTSINKIYNEIRSAGLKSDKNLLYNLLEQLESIYFSFRLRKYSQSLLKAELSLDKKLYFIDNGLINSLSSGFKDDFGKLFENTVFLWLRGKYQFQRGCYYYQNKRECDFLILDREKPQKLIQVCWDISNPDTLKREIAGIVEAARYLDCDDLTIFTAEQEKEINQNDFIIKIVPAWKEMLK